MDKKIRVMIADDQVILAEGIKSVLETDPQLEVIGIAFDGFDALQKMEKDCPDVVLMDIRMPNMNGVVATQSIKAKFPEVKVVILTTFDDSDYILNAINNGASGYLLKDIGSTALIDAVKNAYAGRYHSARENRAADRGRRKDGDKRQRNQDQARFRTVRPRSGDSADAVRGIHKPPNFFRVEDLRRNDAQLYFRHLYQDGQRKQSGRSRRDQGDFIILR